MSKGKNTFLQYCILTEQCRIKKKKVCSQLSTEQIGDTTREKKLMGSTIFQVVRKVIVTHQTKQFMNMAYIH